VEGLALAWLSPPGDAEERLTQLPQALRAQRYPCAPVRVVERPTPTGGTRPLGMAPVAERVVQTAMRLVGEPICAADCHDGSYGSRPTRDAQQAARAMRADLDNRAWRVVAIDCPSSVTRRPHRPLMRLSTTRMADGSRLRLSPQPLQVGVDEPGQGVPTQVGVPHGSPLSPLYSHSSLNLLAPLWQNRGSPAKRGATRPRDAADAILVCRRRPQPAHAACAASAKRRDLPLPRDKTRVTRVIDGFACLGFHCGTRKRPRSGTHPSYPCPATAAQQKLRNRLPSLTSRRAPLTPTACVAMGHPSMTGWAHYCRHTNARQAVRGLQRFVHLRFRRDLPPRSQGRGCGGKRFPHSKL
jgi:retron-type reverse transcriptase